MELVSFWLSVYPACIKHKTTLSHLWVSLYYSHLTLRSKMINLSGLKQLRKLPNKTIMLSYWIEDGSNKTDSTLLFFLHLMSRLEASLVENKIRTKRFFHQWSRTASTREHKCLCFNVAFWCSWLWSLSLINNRPFQGGHTDKRAAV